MRASRALLVAAVAAAVVATAGAGTAYATSKAVTVTVDGQRHQVRTFAGTVAGALHSAHVRASGHDLVVPATSAPLHRGARITVRHARQLTLTLDGDQRSVWVLADSVGEALDQLGLGGAGAVVSASRSRRLPLGGFDVEVRLPHAVTVLADGAVRRLETTEPSVAAVLARLRVALTSTDRVSVPLSTYPAEGMTIRVTRVRSRVVTDTVAIGYPTLRRADGALSKGQSRTVTAGRPGAQRRTFLVTYVDGRLATRRLLSQQRTAAPVTAVIYYGTKAVPQSSYGGSFGGLNWAALARCESGGNPQAVSPDGSYRGLYQFTVGTWQSVGGSGDPTGASSSEQTYRAWVLYQRSGRGPWPVCGRYL